MQALISVGLILKPPWISRVYSKISISNQDFGYPIKEIPMLV